MKQLLTNFILKNWKTASSGIATAIIAGMVAKHTITIETGGAIMGLLVSLGLIAAKDGDKTGATPQ